MLIRSTPPARIVVDATAVDTGHQHRGIGRYARALWRAMSELEPDIVSLRLEPTNRAWVADLSERHLWRFVQSQRTLGRSLYEAGCEVFGATEPWTLPRDARVRVVPTCHDVIPLQFAEHYRAWDDAKWGVYFRWLRATGALKDVPAIIVPSEATGRALQRYLDVPSELLHVIPHGIDHERFRPPSDAEVASVRRRRGLGAEPYVLYLGGYDYRKNVPALVAAFGETGLDDDMLLVLAGPSSAEQRTEVLDAAERAGVGRRVVWTGRVDDDDLPALYGGATLFAYPSLAEGFGLQVLEAMACGCPVLTSNTSALPEVAGEAAELVDPRRVESIANGIVAGVSPERNDELRRLGTQRAATFDWARTARATLEVYRRAATA